ncbi:MAG: hypothetical protein ABEJ75_01960 [Candidatus Nanohaloarchaea archaeon]
MDQVDEAEVKETVRDLLQRVDNEDFQEGIKEYLGDMLGEDAVREVEEEL